MKRTKLNVITEELVVSETNITYSFSFFELFYDYFSNEMRKKKGSENKSIDLLIVLL
jgi:hypothetical protein